jgi:hypothetical protein
MGKPWRKCSVASPGPGQTRNRGDTRQIYGQRDYQKSTDHSGRRLDGSRGLYADFDDRKARVQSILKRAHGKEKGDDDPIGEHAVGDDSPEHGSRDSLARSTHFFTHVDGAVKTYVEENQ